MDLCTIHTIIHCSYLYTTHIFKIGLVIKDWILLINVLKEGILTISG